MRHSATIKWIPENIVVGDMYISWLCKTTIGDAINRKIYVLQNDHLRLYKTLIEGLKGGVPMQILRIIRRRKVI